MQLAESYKETQEQLPARCEGRSDNTVQDAVAYLKNMQQRADEVSSFLLGEGTLDPSVLGGVAGACGAARNGGGADATATNVGGAGTRRRSLVGIMPDSGGAMVTIEDVANGGVAGGVNVEIPNLDEKL